jgi:ATP-dependent DNA helicase RecQ
VCTGEGIEQQVAAAGGPAFTSRVRGAGMPSALTAAGEELFERLRAVRKRIADAEGVPAYIVFSDAALRGMAERRPRTPPEMLEVSGVGPVKLARYGDAFLAVLAE